MRKEELFVYISLLSYQEIRLSTKSMHVTVMDRLNQEQKYLTA